MQIDDYLDQKKVKSEQALYMHFDTHFAETSVLNRAIKYSVLNGENEFARSYNLATTESCKANKQDALPAALAVELFHCSTLIHDDLPCMDDDDLRRGRPTLSY